MFAGEYLCKVDDKGRFLIPSPFENGSRPRAIRSCS